jgi:hypothetical protein
MGTIRVDVACRNLKDRRGTWRRVTLSLLGMVAGLLISETSIAEPELSPKEEERIAIATKAWVDCVRPRIMPAHRRYPTPHAAARAVLDSCHREEARLRALGVSDAIQSKLKGMMTKTHFVDLWRR